MSIEPSDLVTTIIKHPKTGEEVRVASYQEDPAPTSANRNRQPIYLVIPLGERQPPYESWEQILASDVPMPELVEADGNGHTDNGATR